MSDKEILAERFEANRGHLRAIAYRMLGSRGEAEDAVQEAWLRVERSDTTEVENLRGWLTTIVARICLDMLRSRKQRREEPIGTDAESIADESDASHEALLADSVGIAMLIVLERLAPAERVAFVLHDMFNLAFENIAPIVGRSPAAARQLASRARRRVQGAPVSLEADRKRQREIVGAFLAASRGGDFSALLAVLDPQVVLRADPAAVAMSVANANTGAPTLSPEIRSADAVAKVFHGRAQAAQLALVDGEVGVVFAPGGWPRVVFAFVVDNGRIVEIELIADAKRIGAMDVAME